MRSVWALFLLLVGGSLAASYIKFAAIWGQEIWGKDRKHHGTIIFFSFGEHMFFQFSASDGARSVWSRSLQDLLPWEIGVYVKTSVFRNVFTYWLLAIFQIVNISMFPCTRGSGISLGLCLLFIQFFQGYLAFKLSRAQFVYLFATCLRIFSSLHFLAPVNKNMSLISEASFEQNLLCDKTIWQNLLSCSQAGPSKWY